MAHTVAPPRRVGHLHDRTDRCADVTYKSASTQTVMAYDAANRLTAITPASGTSATADLGAGETVAEISNAGSGTIRSMLDLGGSRLATRAGAAAATFTLFDQLGSLIGLVDSTRTITEATRFDGYVFVSSASLAAMPLSLVATFATVVAVLRGRRSG